MRAFIGGVGRTARTGLRFSTAVTRGKTSTGLVGLAVDKNGRETLLNLSAQVLESVKRIPQDSQYRVDVEKWCNFFTKVATSTPDIAAIEAEIALGQIEEVIEMVKDELKLSELYVQEKGWEAVKDEQRRADSMVAAMADSIYFSNPQAAPAAAPPAAAPAPAPTAAAAAPAAAPAASAAKK